MRIVLIFITAIALQSCAVKLHYSPLSKANKFNQQFLDYYSNDSAKLALDFYGGHLPKTWDLKTDSIPKSTKKLLGKIAHSRNVEVLFTTASINQHDHHFGYQYFGMLIPSDKITQADTSKGGFVSNWGTKVYTDFILRHQKKGLINTAYYAPLGKQFFSLVVTKELFKPNGFSMDSLMLMGGTSHEMNTAISGNDYTKLKGLGAETNTKIDKVFNSDEYFTPLLQFDSINLDYVEKTSLQDYYYQAGITAFANISDLENVYELNGYYDTWRKRGNINSAAKKVKQPEPTLDYDKNWEAKVLDLAKNVQVVFINESHYDWRNRYFVELLLPKLEALGYKNLAFETLLNKPNLPTVIIPDKTIGFYTKEPQMANLLREAANLNIKVHAYEDTIKDKGDELAFASLAQIIKREKNQGINLYNAFKKESTSKWIVYCGYDHANKEFFQDSIHSALWYFQALSKVNCGSINQTDYSTLRKKQSALASLPVGFYAVKAEAAKEKKNDIFIATNIAQKKYEMPSAGLIKYEIPDEFFTVSKNVHSCWLSVFIKEEFNAKKENAIPLFIKQLKTDDDKFIYLPKGSYRLIIYNGNDVEIKAQNVLLDGA